MGYFLDDLRAFGINADQWTTATQDEREWRKTIEQGAARSMAKWIAAEKARAGLRHAVVCPNVTGGTTERIAKGSGLVLIRSSKLISHKCILRADAVLSFSGATFVLFCFVFVFLLSRKPRPFVQSFFVLRYACAPTATSSYLTTVCAPSFVSLEVSRFPSIVVPLSFSLYMESTSYVFSFRMVFFYLVTTGWIFDINLLCEDSINRSKLASG